MATAVHGPELPEGPLVIEVGELLPTLKSGARLLAETVVVPTALLVVLMHTSGLLIALVAALGWCYLSMAVRWARGHQLPGTMFVCIAAMTGRVGIALATSSAFVYFLQPALSSGLMALLFVGSAIIGRPVTMRLARDFIAIPAHILSRRRVRRLFTEVALLWGLSRLIDAALSMGMLHISVDMAALSRSVISPVLTVLTILGCAVWGVRVLRKDGVRVSMRSAQPA